MTNIAIFISGTGESAERITKLFNEGNRLRVVLAFGDSSARECLESLRGLGVMVFPFDINEMKPEDNQKIAGLLKDYNIEMIVMDGYKKELSGDIKAEVEGNVLYVTSAEEAPREVVAALRKAQEIMEEEKTENVSSEKTMDEEWAETLKINFEKPRLNQMPPPIPDDEVKHQTELHEDINTIPPSIPEEENLSGSDSSNHRREESYTVNNQREGNYQARYYQGHSQQEERYDNYGKSEKQEPMPSTYLIWAVLVTILCCFIPGIVAIIFSSQVSSRYYSGDFEGAKRASRNAEIWIIVSFVLGVLTATLYLPIAMIG